MAAGQVVTVEPAKPRWGDQIKIAYNPQAPGAKFRVDQEVSLRVSQSVIGASAPIEQRIKLVKTGNMLMGETRVKENANHLQLNFIRSQGESDAGARQVLMVYRTDGQPAHGAWLARANPKNYREAVTAELELYPDNYDAYFVKWRMASYAEPANLREIIETDIKQVAPKIQGEPASWLEALSFGYLQLKQEEESRAVLHKLFEKYPDATQTERAIGYYWYQSLLQHFKGAGRDEIFAIIFELMRRKPASDFSRQYIGNLAAQKEAPLDVAETVCHKWIKESPAEPRPYYILAVARHAHGQSPERIAPMVDRALDLELRENAAHEDQYGLFNLPEAFLLSAEMAFKRQRYSQAVGAIKAAEALDRDSNEAGFVLEARIWEKLNQIALSEKAYRAAWKLGSKEAEAGLQALYQKDKGSLNGFESWLNKSDKDAARATTKPFLSFNVTSLEGKRYELATLRGKIVVLNFWYIGCGPCRVELPELNHLVKDYEGQEVVFLAFTFDNADDLRAFLRQNAFAYQIIPNSQTLVDQIGIQAYPTHFVLNRQGETELVLFGAGEENLARIRHVITRLIGAK